MGEPLTIEALLEGGLGVFLHPAAARQRALTMLPELVATRLMRPVDAATREQWTARLTTEIWPAVRRERGERWDLGWAELTAGLALAIELVHSELPRSLHAEIQGTEAENAWQLARRPFQRFVLLVDSSVHVRRVFVARRERPPGAPVEQSPDWAVDGPAFRDRSHTLMLALLGDGMLPDDAGPVAATGELLPDGQGVGPVGALVQKAEAWHRLHPDGLLISAPPGNLDARVWSALGRPVASSTDRREWAWIVGASLGEILAKLEPIATSIASWDGSPLAEGAVIEPQLSTQDPLPREPSFGSPLLDAAWAAFREARLRRGRRGVVIQGSPGSGKSVFSMTLERRFARGALGAFGYGVRRSARELAADIGSSPSRTWSAGLAVRAPERVQLLETLEKTQRLVPIVDGLDEVQPDQLQAIADWLRAGDGWWIATSRPLRGVGAALPPAWKLRLDDLRPDDARRFLVALGRGDLADAALPTGGQAATPATVQELTRTPLHAALLATMVAPGEDLRRLEPHALYERVFAALLDHACRLRRLNPANAELVRCLLSTVVGELAITWLQSADGFLDRDAIDAAFEGVEMGPMDRVRALEALAFGHLLVPAGAAWEFGHRTMAEWAAATALRRRVERRLQREPEEPAGRFSPHRRAEIELAALGPFLEGDLLPHQGRWATLLRFYAPFVKEPVFFLDRLLGPARATTWRSVDRRRSRDGDTMHERRVLRMASSTETLESWEFAYELLRLCRWSRPAEARAAWALAVRRWLLLELEGPRRGAREGGGALRGFAAAVGTHLPESLDGLIALAARTEAQWMRLGADPLLLLPAIPAARASVLVGLLERGKRSQQLAVIEWYAEHGIEPPHAALDRLARDIPDELDRALGALAAQRGEATARNAGAIARDAAAVLSRLEAAVWKACIEHGREPPRSVMRQRLAAWPAHLDDVLLQWFGAAPTAHPWSTAPEDAYRRRRDVLASLLDQAAVVHRRIVGLLAALDSGSDRMSVLGRLRYYFNDSDDMHLRRIVERMASAQGWTEEPGWEPRPIHDEPVAAAVRDEVGGLHRIRTRAARLVHALDGEALDRIVGELWALFPPDAPVRREILISLDGRETVPRQVSAVAVVRHRGVAWGLDRIRWSDEHLDELRQVARTGAGQSRYEAVCALARATGLDELSELLRHLPSEDEGFTSLAYGAIARRTIAGGEDTVHDVPDVSRLPLGDRAARDVPGWRTELLAKLAGNDTADLATLVDLAIRYEVREVLPSLAQCLTDSGRHNGRLVEAIALLATDRDEGIARTALRHALRAGWPDGRSTWSRLPREDERDATNAGVALARFLRLEDLGVLAEGSVSALRHPSLAAAIRGLGPDAITRLIDLHGVAARRTAELKTTSDAGAESASLAYQAPDPELTKAREQRDALAETLIASLDPSNTAPGELIDLLFRIAGEDVHHVYGVPGSLGSAYDEPGDMDWHSEKVNEGLVQAAMHVLQNSLGYRPDDWPALRRLFRHPSESLCKRAFELCADRAAPHEVAALVVEALQGYIQDSRTRWTGQIAGLLLAGHQSGAGSVQIESPDTATRLVAAVRSRLTPVHKEVVQNFAAHPVAAFRRLAAKWAGELGAGDWVALVVPLLEDVDAGVVWAALGALAVLAPSGMDTWLVGLRGEAWTPVHDHALLDRLLPEDHETVIVRSLRGGSSERLNLAEHVSEATLVQLLARTADRAAAEPGTAAPRADVCFCNYPSQVERVLSASQCLLGPAAVELFRRWLDHPARVVREVGRRQLAARGLLDAALLESLFGSSLPADRLSGAECAVRMGMEHLREVALRAFRGALLKSPTGLRSPPHAPLSEADLRAVALDPPERSFDLWSLRNERLGPEAERRARLLWALGGAPPSFAAAVVLVANELPYDHENLCLEPVGEEIVRSVVALMSRWGEEGALAVLDLIDRGEIEDDHSFRSEIRRLAEQHGRVLAAVRDGAARGGAASSELLAELNKNEFDRDLESLARLLMDEVFPPAWPDPSGWQ